MKLFKGNDIVEIVRNKSNEVIFRNNKDKGETVEKYADEATSREELKKAIKTAEENGFKRVELGGWCITKDTVSNGSDVGLTGPHGMKLSVEEVKRFGRHFKMFDDDGELHYEGYCVVRENMGEEGFAPLDNFGEGNSGCTHIKYRDAKTKEYKTL